MDSFFIFKLMKAMEENDNGDNNGGDTHEV